MWEVGLQQEEGGHHGGAILLEFERLEALDVIHSPSDLQ